MQIDEVCPKGRMSVFFVVCKHTNNSCKCQCEGACLCVCVARLLALLANALESSQVFVATLIAAAGSELLSSRAHVTEARQSPIELDWTTRVTRTTEPLHPFWCTQQLTVFSLDRAVTSTHTHTHTHIDSCLCGPKDRLWRSIMAMIYSVRIRFLFVFFFWLGHIRVNDQIKCILSAPLPCKCTATTTIESMANIKFDYNKKPRTKE